MKKPRIKAVFEAYSQQPSAWRVDEACSGQFQKRGIIEMRFDKNNERIGAYDAKGNVMFSWLVDSVNIEYFNTE